MWLFYFRIYNLQTNSQDNPSFINFEHNLLFYTIRKSPKCDRVDQQKTHRGIYLLSMIYLFFLLQENKKKFEFETDYDRYNPITSLEATKEYIKYCINNHEGEKKEMQMKVMT